MSDRAPSLNEVLEVAIDSHLFHTRVMLPGRIESYDAAEQTATVKPLIKNVVEDEEGEPLVQELGIISKVPVFCFGGGGYSMTAPVAKGDMCMLLFADRSLDNWLRDGEDVDPQDNRMHHLSDAVALVGFAAMPNKLSDVDTAALQIGKQGGPQVRITESHVHLGVNRKEDAQDFAALAGKVKDALDAIVNAFNSHTHPSPSGPTSVPTTPLTTSTDVAASKTKVK